MYYIVCCRNQTSGELQILSDVLFTQERLRSFLQKWQEVWVWSFDVHQYPYEKGGGPVLREWHLAPFADDSPEKKSWLGRPITLPIEFSTTRVIKTRKDAEERKIKIRTPDGGKWAKAILKNKLKP